MKARGSRFREASGFGHVDQILMFFWVVNIFQRGSPFRKASGFDHVDLNLRLVKVVNICRLEGLYFKRVEGSAM